jgi:PAS domain S-box-containing protein
MTDSPDKGSAPVRDYVPPFGIGRDGKAFDPVREAELRRMTELLPQLVWSTTADGYHDYYNEQWYAYTGMPRPDAASAKVEGWNWKNYLHPADHDRTIEVWRTSLTSGDAYDIEYRLKRASDGMYRWFLARALPLRGDDGGVIRWFGTCTDIEEQKHAEQQLRVLAEAGAILSVMDDVDVALAGVARLVVPRLADWCAIDLVEGEGKTRRVTVVHPDPDKVRFAHELSARYPDDPNASTGLPEVLRSGKTEWVQDIPEELIDAAARDAEHLRLIKALALRSYVIVPFNDGARTVGAITIVSAESGRRFTPADVSTLEELARRVSLALDRVRRRRELGATREELELQAEQLQQQATELELQNEQLQSQASEMEMQTQQLSEQAVELEMSNEELATTNLALAQRDERLSLALEAGSLGWWEWDIRANTIAWSEQTERMHGVERGGFGGSFEEYQKYIHDADRPRVVELIQQTIEERHPSFHVQFRYLRGDGKPRWLETDARLILDADGEPLRLLGVTSDVTDDIRAEEELEQLVSRERTARREAEVANAAKSQFLATMSHELRTPLNAVTGYADLLAMGIRGPVTQAQSEDIGRIKRSGRHLLTVINDILNFAKLEAGQVEFDIQDVRIGEAVSEMEALIAPQVLAKGLTLDYESCDPSLTARADRDKLQQILINLLTNAIKFTESGGKLTVTCDETRDEVRVHVADTGIGIPAANLASVFDPFVQVNRQLSRPSEGVGLGLAISRDLARAMGGDLSAISTLGAGSTFTLALPKS